MSKTDRRPQTADRRWCGDRRISVHYSPFTVHRGSVVLQSSAFSLQPVEDN